MALSHPCKDEYLLSLPRVSILFQILFLNNDNLNKKQNHSEFNELKKRLVKMYETSIGNFIAFGPKPQ